MTANGSHDKIVKPEDLLSYQAEPPLDISQQLKHNQCPAMLFKLILSWIHKTQILLKNWLWKYQKMNENNMKIMIMIVLELLLIVENNCVQFMKMVGLNVTHNTITNISLNTMFHSTMALRTTLLRTTLISLKLLCSGYCNIYYCII